MMATPPNDDQGDDESAFSYERRGSASVAGVDQDEDESNFVTTSRSRGVARNNLVIPWTFQMVEDGTLNYPHIISWTKKGDAFEVKDIKALEKNVLGVKYFDTNKYSSFRRQLNKYQFERSHRQSIRKDVSATRIDIYRHKFFQRGQPDLLSQITKPTGGKFNCSEEVKAMKTRLSELGHVQTELQKSLRNLEHASIEQMTYIGLLQQHNTSKDTVIRAMELRLKALEDRVSRNHPLHPQDQQLDSRTVLAASLPTATNTFPHGLERATSLLGDIQWPRTESRAEPPSPPLAIPMDTSDFAKSARTLDPHPNMKRRKSTSARDASMAVETGTPALRMDSMTWLKGKYYPPDGNEL